MKKLFIILLGGLLLPLFAGAQEVRDARQRTLSTIIADALAQLPAQTPVQYNEMMEELAATGSVGIREMAGMLVPAAEGSNAPVEYALSGVVHYVTEQGREEARNAVRQGLAQSIAACTDNPNRAFLLSLPFGAAGVWHAFWLTELISAAASCLLFIFVYVKPKNKKY